MDIVIKPLSPDLIDDFLYYFDNIAFSDNPDWGTCYCHFYHFAGTNEQFFKRTAEENRNTSKELILAGKMNGLIAYLDNKPVGWCNINSKVNFAKIPYEERSTDKIASLICFIIAPSYRKQGIARQLLRYACSNFKDKGFDLIEAYPRTGENLSDAHSYRGPISLYKSEGFTVYKKLKDYYVMRKKL
ncbi:MAG: GNAT family N-acetyltransferase [Promethearchaeota archaeon]|nr:MAG: GNAT family N-acetyltransferase [Candidatus Lokiarchaeota archaeon]